MPRGPVRHGPEEFNGGNVNSYKQERSAARLELEVRIAQVYGPDVELHGRVAQAKGFVKAPVTEMVRAEALALCPCAEQARRAPAVSG